MIRATLQACGAWVRNRLRFERRVAPDIRDRPDMSLIPLPLRQVELRALLSPQNIGSIFNVIREACNDFRFTQRLYWTVGHHVLVSHFGYPPSTRCDITGKVHENRKLDYLPSDVNDMAFAVDDPTSNPEAPDSIKKKFVLYLLWSSNKKVLKGKRYAVRQAQQMNNAVAVFRMYAAVEPTQRGVILWVGKYYVWCIYFDGEQFSVVDLKLASTFND